MLIILNKLPSSHALAYVASGTICAWSKPCGHSAFAVCPRHPLDAHLVVCPDMGGMGMGIRTRMACLGVGAVIGLSAATQIVALKYQYQPALGWGLAVGKPSAITVPDTSNMTKAQKRNAMRAAATARAKAPVKIYPPWNFLIWQKKWGQDPKYKTTLSMGVPALMLGVALGAMLIRLFDTGTTSTRSGGLHNGKRRRPSGWGDVRDLIKDGLGNREGVILGCIDKPSRLKACLGDRWHSVGQRARGRCPNFAQLEFLRIDF
jgi:hypothetical protein